MGFDKGLHEAVYRISETIERCVYLCFWVAHYTCEVDNFLSSLNRGLKLVTCRVCADICHSLPPTYYITA